MGNVVINGQSCAVSTYSGNVVAAFPDVCKAPGAGNPVPIPYPTAAAVPAMGETRLPPLGGGTIGLRNSNFTMSTGDEAGTMKGVVSSNMSSGFNTGVSTGVAVKGSNVNINLKVSEVAATLRNRMSLLHGQLLGLPPSDPNRWHAIVDDYVQTVAQLYIAVASR